MPFQEKRIMDEIDKADEEVIKSIIFPVSTWVFLLLLVLPIWCIINKKFVLTSKMLTTLMQGSKDYVRRIEDDDEDEDLEVDLHQPSSSLSQSSENISEVCIFHIYCIISSFSNFVINSAEYCIEGLIWIYLSERRGRGGCKKASLYSPYSHKLMNSLFINMLY